MRSVLVTVAALGALAGACPPARAGLYHTGERAPLSYPPGNMLLWVGDLRQAVNKDIPLVRGAPFALPPYRSEIEALEGRLRTGPPLSTEERVNLAACYLRLRTPDPKDQRANDAIRVLQGADGRHFLVLANLAVAYHLKGELELALRYQRQVLKFWPAQYSGWRWSELVWYRRVETFYLRLLENRFEEARRASAPGRKPQGKLPIDPIFPGFRVVGPDGTYSPGVLAAEMAALLPPDYLQIVYQLVHWFPHDNRLYWLLGELFGVGGAFPEAHTIFKQIRNADQAVLYQDLIRHRQLLENAMEAVEAAAKAGFDYRRPSTHLKMLSYLTPRGHLAGPGGGGAAEHVALLAPLVLAPHVEQGPALPTAAAADPAPAASPLPNWRHIGVGFAGGALAAALLGLQWQEWRRRRRSAASPAPPEPPAPDGAGAAPADTRISR